MGTSAFSIEGRPGNEALLERYSGPGVATKDLRVVMGDKFSVGGVVGLFMLTMLGHA